MRIGTDTREIILSSLAGKEGVDAKNIIGDLAERYGLSRGYVYRISQSVRACGRAARRDIGARRLAVTDEQLAWIETLTTKHDFAANHAIELAEINGIIAPGAFSPSIYNTWLRQKGVSRARMRKDVSPTQEFEGRWPNDIHQFDTTKLEQLHYDKETDTLSWNPRANRKNSRGEKPDSIWLYSLLDDYSRCKFAMIYRSLNQYNHLDFLCHAWSEKPQRSEFPFYGVPGHIYMDNGGGNQAIKFLVALKKLDVHPIPTNPSSDKPFAARKRGKIENTFKSYGEWLKIFQLRPLTWAEACESLHQFVLALNRRVHSVTHAAPFSRWLEIGTPQHAPAEELWKLFYFDHDRRTVKKNLTFSVDAHIYRLPEKKPFIDWIDEKIDVYWQPGNYSTVFAVFGAREIELAENTAEIVRPAFSYPREEREATAVESARAAAGEADYSSIKLYATDGIQNPKSKIQNPSYLPRKGQEFDDSKIAEKTVVGEDGRKRPSFAPEEWCRGELAAAHCLINERMLEPPLDQEDRQWLRDVIGGRDKISVDELRGVAALYKDQREKRRADRQI